MNIMEDGPSLIWGFVCILLLLSSLAARRLPLGYIAKAAFAWIAIFAALFAIFSFRFEFKAVWERVKADISGTAGQSVRGEDITIRRQDDGHYWLQLDVNGRPVRFMIDSGATTTAVNGNTARETGIEVDTTGYPVFLNTANGRVTAQRGVILSLKIGSRELGQHDVVVSESFGDTNVLGMNFLDSMQSWRVEGNVMTLKQ
ncbi:TIGR02281 family clan AA aspartic protease [Sphingorhabdus sp.]|jgi:aspartyl protease family protein|uniref:TIGR02281 family clan AA aspartic protease n=1 Tax=Sphingorhabdus sp. TaxID=1902408 RepID=UPI0037CBF4E4